MTHTRNPAADEARGVPDSDLLGGVIDREHSRKTYHRQVRRLAARFALPPCVAAVVAEHAFSQGAHR
jgi:hypothetical protein